MKNSTKKSLVGQNYDESPIETQDDLFKNEWKKREHRCSVCKRDLPMYSWYYCAHILGKGAYPLFKLASGNLVIMCHICHDLYDHHTNEAKTLPQFKWVFERAEVLKRLYNLISKHVP